MPADSAVRDAALRLRHELALAREGNYYEHGWYAYMARWDVEALVDAVLSPVPEQEHVRTIEAVSLLSVGTTDWPAHAESPPRAPGPRCWRTLGDGPAVCTLDTGHEGECGKR